MFQDVLITFLLSLSPFGEARIGIPYGELNGIPIIWTLVIALSANLLVFPFVYKGIQLANKHLWKYRSYRKRAISLSSKARKKTSKSIRKYGVWGLMVFVMIPLPVTGAYIGTIAAFVLGISYQKSLLSISLGVTFSSIIIATLMHII
ncbi:MAG: small multi-drug export protein [Flavobacteriales bacterium]|jgi:uncharacterized membrane protein|nr:small multi-drug export protein [Flavobacteriales bacterium]MBT6808214.1 small multi-drug export protein [Flavobacteriales bacterium]